MKPFNLHAAIDGHPVVTRDGRKATIIEIRPSSSTPIFVVSDQHHFCTQINGIATEEVNTVTNDDLFMYEEPKPDRWTKEKAHFEKGGMIEWRGKNADGWSKWKPITNPGFFHKDGTCEYRIAPEPRYAPWSFEDDLLGMKVKLKHGSEKYSISGQRLEHVTINNTLFSYKELLQHWTLLDGSPCGKEDKNEQ